MLNEIIGKKVHLYIGMVSELTKPFTGIIDSVDSNWVYFVEKRRTQLIPINKISRIVIAE